MKILNIAIIHTKTNKTYRKIEVELEDGTKKSGSFWEKDIVLEIGQEVDWKIEENNGFINFKPKAYDTQGYKQTSSLTKDQVAIKMIEDQIKTINAKIDYISGHLGLNKIDDGFPKVDRSGDDEIPF